MKLGLRPLERPIWASSDFPTERQTDTLTGTFTSPEDAEASGWVFNRESGDAGPIEAQKRIGGVLVATQAGADWQTVLNRINSWESYQAARA